MLSHNDLVKYMPSFHKASGEIVFPGQELFNPIISEWADYIKRHSRVGLVPLFITGLGVSKGETIKIPDIGGILQILRRRYVSRGGHDGEISGLFSRLLDAERPTYRERGLVARLLNAFQERADLRDDWKGLNEELLKAILTAYPTPFHKLLAGLYETHNAVCITLNFDGLLIREFVLHRNARDKHEKAFSLPMKDECERFFLRTIPFNSEKGLREYLEIQMRGDILYVTCDTEGFCPERGKKHSLWAFLASYSKSEPEKSPQLESNDFLRCASCGRPAISYLSFPGSYEKERDMRELLEVIWKFLAFRIGSVTVAGMSGEWDPQIVAFLGDLISERDIPLLVIDKFPNRDENIPSQRGKFTYIISELVKTQGNQAVALGVDADGFMTQLVSCISKGPLPAVTKEIYFKHGHTIDEYWEQICKETSLNRYVNREFTDIENDMRNRLTENEMLSEFAQLGLKSYFLGIGPTFTKYHKRLNHSIGVMKVASFLYEKAFENSDLPINICEQQFLRLAALLHDVGHLPFSHLIENVFNELNWKPAGYKSYYSHLFQTEERILQIFDAPNLSKRLTDYGYSVSDLISLVNGSFGVGYLDAIINSPLDADKIDYIFRDTYSTDRKISLSPVRLLEDITKNLTVTPERYLLFSGISAKVASELLEARQYLYQNLYLQPGIVVLEGIVKLIIKTYFVHFLTLTDGAVLERVRNVQKGGLDCADLGEYKIAYCIKDLQDLFRNAKESLKRNENFELKIVSLMYDRIKERERLLSNSFRIGLQRAYKTILSTNSEPQLHELEAKVTRKRIRGKRDKISETIRDVMFRMPGAAIIESVAAPSFLSTADARKERERSDGTKIYSECILVPTGNYQLWFSNDGTSMPLHGSSLRREESNEMFLFLYPLSGDPEDSYFRQTVNLFNKQLSRNAVMEAQ